MMLNPMTVLFFRACSTIQCNRSPDLKALPGLTAAIGTDLKRQSPFTKWHVTTEYGAPALHFTHLRWDSRWGQMSSLIVVCYTPHCAWGPKITQTFFWLEYCILPLRKSVKLCVIGDAICVIDISVAQVYMTSATDCSVFNGILGKVFPSEKEAWKVDDFK